ncbi:MAG: winged helix-turn-helix domain-containing protein [Pseudomonadota bacterium]
MAEAAPILRLRVVFPERVMLGPGKADLLALIGETGSISAAGRSMQMSYKRAWLLVETMNTAFAAPLVESTRGGPKGGGARLTELGMQVLATYRALENKAAHAGAEEIAALESMLRDMSEGK